MSKRPEGYPFDGSIHQLSAGYGRGIRYLTSRNLPTLPASVPQFRHVPDTPNFLSGTTNSKLIGSDERSLLRNAHNIVNLTSGEYGRFLLESETKSVRLNQSTHRQINYSGTWTGKNPNPASQVEQRETNIYQSFKSDVDDDITTKDGIKLKANNTYKMNTTGSFGNPSGDPKKTVYIDTLNSLDQFFNKQNKRDLYAASLPNRSQREQRYTAMDNHKSSEDSKGWALSLRREKN